MFPITPGFALPASLLAQSVTRGTSVIPLISSYCFSAYTSSELPADTATYCRSLTE
jgi:hypothetical protein